MQPAVPVHRRGRIRPPNPGRRLCIVVAIAAAVVLPIFTVWSVGALLAQGAFCGLNSVAPGVSSSAVGFRAEESGQPDLIPLFLKPLDDGYLGGCEFVRYDIQYAVANLIAQDLPDPPFMRR